MFISANEEKLVVWINHLTCFLGSEDISEACFLWHLPEVPAKWVSVSDMWL